MTLLGEVLEVEVLDGALEGLDLEAMLEAIRCPILLFHGEPALGALILEDDIAWARQYARNVDVVQVPGAGHDIPLEMVVEHGMRFLGTVAAS